MYGLRPSLGIIAPVVTSAFCNSRWGWTSPDCWGRHNYPSPPAPPVVASTLPGGVEIPAVPASGEAAGETIDALLAQQMADWKAQNQTFFETVDANVNAESSNWWMWALGAVGLGVFALVAVGGGSARRYGR